MDLAKQKALAQRLLNKVASSGTVTVRSTARNVEHSTQSASVSVKIKDRIAGTDGEPVKYNAIMSATPFPLEGGELLLDNVIYDIVEVTQVGTGNEHIIQNVVLHGR